MKKEFWILLTILILSGIYFGSSSQSTNPLNSVSQITELLNHKQNNNEKIKNHYNEGNTVTKTINPYSDNSIETTLDYKFVTKKIKSLLTNSNINTNKPKNNEHPPMTLSNNLKNIDTICICQDNSNLYPYYNDETGLVGYESHTGKRIIEAKFHDGKPFSEGLAAVYDGKRWGYINTLGNYVIPPKFGGYEGNMETIVNPFVKGSAAVYLGQGNASGFADKQSGQYALIDTKGNIIKI